MSSAKKVEILDGAINFYEKTSDGSYSKVRFLKKKINGVGSNNTIMNLNTDAVYGTKCDWTNTVVDCYLNEIVFEKKNSLAVWAKAIKSSDNQFTIKVYEKYSVSVPIGYSVVGSKEVSYTSKSGISFNYSGTMFETVIFGFSVSNIRLYVYKDGVLVLSEYASISKRYGAQSKGFNWSYSNKSRITHTYKIKIVYSIGNPHDHSLRGSVSGNVSTITTAENNSTKAIFYAYEN